jgi:23S rRNA (cytosine1962-C5)-methyltransferase
MRSSSISRPPRIAEALRRRSALAATSAVRLLHGAADGLPGLAVDRFADVCVIHADAPDVLEHWLDNLYVALKDTCSTAYAKVRPRGLQQFVPTEPVWGPTRTEVEAIEHDVLFEVRPAAGLSVGLFVDMREVRQWLRRQSADRSVLNLFAYTCSFGVCAALGGASRVVNLDVSRPYLDWGKRNYALNGLPVDAHDFIYGDAVDWLQRFARREQRFDVVIVDPPSFSSTPFSVTRDYARLIAAAAMVVSRKGVLLAATNHAATSRPTFEGWLQDGLVAADRGGRILRRWHEPEDFPVAPRSDPYLKVCALELD